MQLTEKLKAKLEGKTYEELLYDWRFCKIGDPLFQEESGKFYTELLDRKGKEIGPAGMVAASKNIGWER